MEVLRDLESSQSEKSGKVQPLKTKWSVIAKVRLGEPFEVRSRREHELMIVKGVVTPHKDGKFLVKIKCHVTSSAVKVLAAPGVYKDSGDTSTFHTQASVPPGEQAFTISTLHNRGNQQVATTRFLLSITPYVPLDD